MITNRHKVRQKWDFNLVGLINNGVTDYPSGKY